MTFKGQNNGWKPSSRRHRRQGGAPKAPKGSASDRSTPEDADRTILVVLAVFTLVALAVAVAVGIFLL